MSAARGILAAVLGGATLLGVGQVTANAGSSPFVLPKSPVSASTLYAQAYQAGKFHFSGGKLVAGANGPRACSPPCSLPNVDVKTSSSPINETPIAANPSNPKQLLTGANDYNCGNIQGFYASNDGGATWPNQTCMTNLPGNSGCGDPGVGYNTKNIAYISGLDCGANPTTAVVEQSSNNGASWSAPIAAVKTLAGGDLIDKDWLAINDYPKSKQNKETDDLAICTTDFASNNNSTITVSNSENGKKWKTVAASSQAVYPNVNQFCDLSWEKSGALDLTYMNCTANGPTGDCGGTTATMYFQQSTNDGLTWSKAVVIDRPALAPDNGCCFYGVLPNTSERVSNIPVSGVFGTNVYVTYYNWTGTFMQVVVATSTNDGATWGKAVAVRPADTHDQFFPWLSVDQSNGAVNVTWDDRFNDASNVNYTYTYAQSTTGGASFSAASDLATTASNPFNDGFGGSFIGDYTGNTVSAPNITNAVWTDTRTGIDNEFSGGYDQ
ncbi:MAG TPA: hypothetical protein VKX16_05085 [Chloroflexota bacterium]|nr:hypothetical protein [Chloroflexota bacterium]